MAERPTNNPDFTIRNPYLSWAKPLVNLSGLKDSWTSQNLKSIALTYLNRAKWPTGLFGPEDPYSTQLKWSITLNTPTLYEFYYAWRLIYGLEYN